ncbi:MAG: hypothetical protein VKS61_15670 [Candidatus Sericytochromatia bacterium]|nr:hypothetical protein [Candidatus Sericytochromatia bacterium]
MAQTAFLRFSLTLLALGVSSCRLPEAAPAPAPAPSSMPGNGPKAEVPTARVRLTPATFSEPAPAARQAVAGEPPQLFRLGAGLWEVPAPRAGNGLYLALASPEWPTEGTPLQLQVEGAAPNPPEEGAVSIATEATTSRLAACGASLAEATDPAPPASARRLLTVATAQDQEPFWIIRAGLPAPPGEAYDEVERVCRRVHSGKGCHVYLDQRLAVEDAIAEARALGEAFDDQLLPGVSRLFGPAPQPGIDGDARIFLVISPDVSADGRTGTLAYFARRDQRTRGDGTPSGRHSNQRDALFIDARTLVASRRADLYTAVAHELGHLLHFTQHAPKLPPGTSEKLWLEEALAMLASHACGYTLETAPSMYHHVAGFLAQPHKYSLTDWPGNPGQAGYGVGYLFLLYLQERFGEALITEIVQGSLVGKAQVEKVLQGQGSSFQEAFGDWALAVLNDGLFEQPGSPWCYPHTQLRTSTPHGPLKGPAVMRLGPEGAQVPRRADVAYFFHVRPLPDRRLLGVRLQGPGRLAGMVP